MNEENITSPIRGAHVDPAIAWIEELIAEHTPKWGLFYGWLAFTPGLRWLQRAMPLVRKFTDLEVKTETNIQGGKGFRAKSTLQTRTLRVYKRGRMIAEKKFPALLIRKSPYSKII